MSHGKVTVTAAEAVTGRRFECYTRGKEGALAKQTFSVVGGRAIMSRAKTSQMKVKLSSVKALFALMGRYLGSKGTPGVGTPEEFATDFLVEFRKDPEDFNFLVTHGATGDTAIGYVCAYICSTGGYYIKHVIVDNKFSGLNFGALLIEVAEWRSFMERTAFKVEHANEVRMKLTKAETPEDVRCGMKVFLNFAEGPLNEWYARLGYRMPTGGDRAMVKDALDRAHPESLKKSFMNAKGEYIGTASVEVSASIPRQDAPQTPPLGKRSRSPTPLLQRGRSPTPMLPRSPSPKPLLGKRGRSLTPLLPRGRSKTTLLGKRGRSLTPLLPRGRSQTPLLHRGRSLTPLLPRGRSQTPQMESGAARPCPPAASLTVFVFRTFPPLLCRDGCAR
jgi:hypothetical protein